MIELPLHRTLMDLLLTTVYQCCPRTLLRVIPYYTRWMALSRKTHSWQNYLTSVGTIVYDSPQERYHTLLVELAGRNQVGHLAGLVQLPKLVLELRSLEEGCRVATRAGHGVSFIEFLQKYESYAHWLCEYCGIGQWFDEQYRSTHTDIVDYIKYKLPVLVYDMEVDAERNDWPNFERSLGMVILLYDLEHVYQCIIRCMARTTSPQFYEQAVKYLESYSDDSMIYRDSGTEITTEMLRMGKFELVTELIGGGYYTVPDTPAAKDAYWSNILRSSRPDALELLVGVLPMTGGRSDLRLRHHQAFGCGTLLEEYVRQCRESSIWEFIIVDSILLSYRASAREVGNPPRAPPSRMDQDIHKRERWVGTGQR